MDSLGKLIRINIIYFLGYGFLKLFDFIFPGALFPGDMLIAIGLFLAGEDILIIACIVLKRRYKFWDAFSIVGSFFFAIALIFGWHFYLSEVFLVSRELAFEFFSISVFLAVLIIYAIFFRRDYMTGLLNQCWLVNTRFYEGNREKIAGVVMGDIENFFLINSDFGRAVGDKIIRKTAKRIEDQLQDHAYQKKIFRMEGDEFLFFVEKVQDIEKARAQLEKIFLDPFEVRGKIIQLGCLCESLRINADETLSQTIRKVYEAIILSKHRDGPMPEKSADNFLRHKLSSNCLVLPSHSKEQRIKLLMIIASIFIIYLGLSAG